LSSYSETEVNFKRLLSRCTQMASNGQLQSELARLRIFIEHLEKLYIQLQDVM
jgi:hypothetical protein